MICKMHIKKKVQTKKDHPIPLMNICGTIYLKFNSTLNKDLNYYKSSLDSVRGIIMH